MLKSFFHWFQQRTRHRLFWKVFLWIWLITFVQVWVITLNLLAWVDSSEYAPEREAIFQELTKAVGLLEAKCITLQGLEESKLAPQCVKDLHLPGGQLFVMDHQGGVLGGVASSSLLRLYRDSQEDSHPLIRSNLWEVLAGPSRVAVGSSEYLVFVAFERPQIFINRFHRAFLNNPYGFTGSFLIGLILCVLLSAYLVSPIRRLQAASRRLARGNFDTSVGMSVLERNDEFGDLGRDFDRMASQLNMLQGYKERLLRDVSHELRTPLTRLQLSLALARKKGGETVQVEHDRIEKEANRLNHMVGQIIQWSRMENVVQMTPEVFSLDKLLKRLVEDGRFEAEANGKSVELTRLDSFDIKGGSSWLGSAIENCLRNCIRFSPEGTSVRVALTVSKETLDEQAVLTIRDQGPGVSEEGLAHLFEPFYRADNNNGQSNGSGLGLAIAARAVEYHGGTIRARNASPGLEFRIQLPSNGVDSRTRTMITF
ncbi:ATP-binding protein [Endozoicomonadaceae bacterium StTr2]